MAGGKSRVLSVTITSDAKDFKKGTDQAARDASNFEKSIGGMAAGSAIATKALGGIASAAGGAMSAAQELERAQLKANNVWGAGTSTMKTWADNAVKSYGMSSQAALEAAANSGAYWQAMGKTSAESQKLAQGTVETAAALASYNGLGVDQTLDMISGALRGEYDSLQQLIPTISAASVEQQALAMTHKDSAKDLTDSEKAMAAYSLIVQGAKPAIDSMGASMQTAAGQQATMRAEVQTLAAQIGETLLPMFQGLLTIGLQVSQWMVEHQQLLMTVGAAVAALAAGVVAINGAYAVYTAATKAAELAQLAWNSQILMSIRNAATMALNVAAMTLKWAALTAAELAHKGVSLAVAAATKAMTLAQKALNLVMMANPVMLVVAAVTALIAILVKAYQESETFRAIVDKLWQILKNSLGAAFDFVTGTIRKFVDWIKRAWDWAGKMIQRAKDLVGALNPFGGHFFDFSSQSDQPEAFTSAVVDLTPFLLPAPPTPDDLTREVRRAAIPPSLGGFRAAAGGAQAVEQINITVNGALDPNAVAEQIDRLLKRRARLMGSAA